MRQFIRHPTDVPITYHLAESTDGHRDRLRNIGEGGLCFSSQHPIAPGTRIGIEIPISEPAFEAEGTVVWCRSSATRNGVEVGVRFDGVQTAYAVRLVEQVCQIEHYRKEIERLEGRVLSSEEAALECVERYAAQFPH